MRPVIGVTAKISFDDKIGEITNLGCKNQAWMVLAQDYVQSLMKAGAAVVIIPIVEEYKMLGDIVGRLDGILFSGGNDISPLHYGEKEDSQSKDCISFLDETELYLYHQIFQKTSMPILGICRGLQLMNVAHGGTLIQEMRMGEYPKHHYFQEPVPKDLLVHRVNIHPDTLLHTVMKKNEIETNSFHHQSIKKTGKDLRVNAMSEDGVIEGIESMIPGRFVMGVQWHPEMLASGNFTADVSSKNLFDFFVEEARRYSQNKNQEEEMV